MSRITSVIDAYDIGAHDRHTHASVAIYACTGLEHKQSKRFTASGFIPPLAHPARNKET